MQPAKCALYSWWRWDRGGMAWGFWVTGIPATADWRSGHLTSSEASPAGSPELKQGAVPGTQVLGQQRREAP